MQKIHCYEKNEGLVFHIRPHELHSPQAMLTPSTSGSYNEVMLLHAGCYNTGALIPAKSSDWARE